MPKILIGNIKGPQGAQGIQGPQGPVGATGPQGPMPDLINNALATEAGVAALDAAMGKTLQDQLTELNSNMEYHDVAVTLNTDVINECTIHCRRNGTVAAISVNGINGSNAINPGEIYTIATGLPPCSLGFQDLTVEIDATATSVHKRAWVNNQGALFFVTTESNYTGNIFIGGTYACQ